MIPDFSSHYSEVARLAVTGKMAQARETLRKVEGGLPILEAERMGVSKRTQLQVFRRDRYTCRYCSRRVVFAPVLRAFSVLFAPDFPYHPHGKMTDCHIAFWRDIASCDHLVPVARGGSADADNLRTSCYMCNSMKQNWLITELRWQCLPESDSDWDGLSSIYPELIDRMQKPIPEYFRGWARALHLCS